ncbi:MurR/RpiR family transcriptional regulator [Eremococcus coleocola]|uniref:MurR/RpiR family transcriptional regulator n=1 Tax=Eremococcus coleocola TaxID=88132 RepID=UPI0003FCB004|nr:MurR/RpiR family transcriptional regulator [Eremococcus coleocola]
MKSVYLKKIIKDNKFKFSHSEDQFVEYLLVLNEGQLTGKSISEMAFESGVSQTTIYNFVKKLGFHGFRDFKIQLALNTGSNSNKKMTAFSDITNKDNAMTIAKKIISFNQNSLETLNESLDKNTLNQCIRLIKNANNLHFIGQGGSSVVALDAYQKFMRSKFHCSFVSDYHMQVIHALKIQKGDVCFLYSHSGETKETIQIAQMLNANGISIITLTGNANSPLVALSTQSIVIYSEESQFRTESLTARILYLTVMDILYTKIMFEDEHKNKRTLENIRETISDIKD